MAVKTNESLEDKVADAVTDATASVADTQGDDADKTEDAKLELFARKISDNVTKAIAELLNPSKKSDQVPDDEEEVEEEGKKVRRKRKPATPVAKPKRKLFLFG